jgi:aromatic ring-opening dioxygenase catalytic subunit (LigB family)
MPTMNTLERNRYTDTWRAVGAALPRPRAVLNAGPLPAGVPADQTNT